MQYPIENFLNVQMAYGPQFTAGGERIAYVSNASGAPQLWLVTPPTESGELHWPDQLTFNSDRVLGVWSAPDNQSLLYSQDTGGNENAQLFLRRPDGRTTNLTAGHEAAMHIFGCWTPEGDSFIFAANRRHPGRFDLYRQQLAGGEAEMILAHDEYGFLHAADVSPDGQCVLLIRAGASAAYDLFELAIATGQLRKLNAADSGARYLAAYYSAGGNVAYLLTDLEDDFLHVARLELAGGEWQAVVRHDWDIETLAFTADRRRLAYTLNVAGDSALYLHDLDTLATQQAPLPSGAPGVVGFNVERLSFSPDERQIAFDYVSATRTMDVFLWELADNSVRQATRSAHGGIRLDTFVTPQLIDYPTFDSRRIPAWLYQPPAGDGDGPLPVVVFVHGGPESQFRPYFHFWIQYLVHNGYAVLAPNVRGSSGYGKAYGHLDDVELRMDSVADLAHANYWLRTQPAFDPKRIVVYGGSYGGFMVLSALTTYPDLWAAGVDVVGISNFVTFLENTSEYRRSHRESEYGSLANDRDFLESISPNNHLDRISAPLMVIHGANDPRVPVSEAEQLVAALAERDVPAKLLVFDDEGHGIIKLKNKLQLYPEIVSFLQEHVAG